MSDNDIILSETVNGKTFVVAKDDRWPFKYWVGDRADLQSVGKRARTEDEAVTYLAEMVE